MNEEEVYNLICGIIIVAGLLYMLYYVVTK